MNRLLLAVILTPLLVSGCAIFMGDDTGPNYGKTLADLNEVVVLEEYYPVPVTSIDNIEQIYRTAIDVAKDAGVRHRILTRLGDLEMVRAEQRQLNATEQAQFFTDAIDFYTELLVLNSERQNEEGTPTNERLLYQLSKAYALDGRMEESNEVLGTLVEEFPASPFAAEADFRRAEKAFSDGNYELAEDLYASVMSAGDQTPFYINSVYMNGWSQFKRGRYRASLKPFTEVLDRTLLEGVELEELSNTQRNMSKDTLRVLAISFSYLDGADSITEVYKAMGLRHYQHRVYMALGDLYLEKSRFRDSADTYRHYVAQFPNTDHAPSFSIKAIEVYDLGGFPSLVLPAKEEYVTNYGSTSQFWMERDDDKRAFIKPKLAIYLDELSSYYHAKALASKKLHDAYANKKAAGQRVNKNAIPASPKADFLKAASLYEEFVLTFPDSEKTPEMAYLMGESFYDAGELAKAITAYETVAYNFLDKKRGAEAGYSAVVALQQLMDQAAADPARKNEYDSWRDHKIESAISYADYYPYDPRAVTLLTKAAQEIFEKNEYERAADIALRVTNWQPAPSVELAKSAWLIVAHSRFDLHQYADAEFAYQQLLNILPANDKDRPAIVDRLAASAYKQSEAQLADGDMAGAVERLLNIKNLAPNSDIAATAQYDAATYLITMKNWAMAETVLLQFKALYGGHALAKTLAPKFALIYQESEQWDKAAQSLADMSSSAGTDEERRQALYLSAELYEKAGKLTQSIDMYRDYATRYPQPFDIATEARFHLVELYEKTNDDSKRNYWLRQLIDEDKKAGKSRTPRSQFLAAYASAKFADDEFVRYQAIKLSLPLKVSLKKKRTALDITLKAYRDVAQYGVAEFATQASHRIGSIYSQLSKDLMASQRPDGLDELALEQYEILLEEQALPFEDKAIEILAANAERSWEGIYDDWVKQSFKTLGEILPARYGKKERAVEFSDVLY